jgi:hypothetical protein
MDSVFRDNFVAQWRKYFNDAELPVTFYYTNELVGADVVKQGPLTRCVIGALAGVRRGKSLAFDVDAVGCPGGKRYLGFRENLMPNFEYFLSCGIPDKLEGERYKKTPHLVEEAMKEWPKFTAPGRFIVFKRWDKLENYDIPEVVIFFAPPDVLSGLFTLSSFDEAGQNMVIAPFGSGCSTIVQDPYLEKDSSHPRSIIGLFDVSARPFVSSNTLTFSTPMNKFTRMIANMDESFLITESWAKVQKRIK